MIDHAPKKTANHQLSTSRWWMANHPIATLKLTRIALKPPQQEARSKTCMQLYDIVCICIYIYIYNIYVYTYIQYIHKYIHSVHNYILRTTLWYTWCTPNPAPRMTAHAARKWSSCHQRCWDARWYSQQPSWVCLGRAGDHWDHQPLVDAKGSLGSPGVEILVFTSENRWYGSWTLKKWHPKLLRPFLRSATWWVESCRISFVTDKKISGHDPYLPRVLLSGQILRGSHWGWSQ